MTVFATEGPAHQIREYMSTQTFNRKMETEMSNSTQMVSQPTDPSEITFSALLADETGFQLFMEHVSREYSDEHMMFLAELLCIKDRYQSLQCNQLELSFDSNHCAVIDIPSNFSKNMGESICSYFFKSDGTFCTALKLPLSSGTPSHHVLLLQFNTKTPSLYHDYFIDTDDYFDSLDTAFSIEHEIHGLYWKYIHRDSDYAINIDYAEHRRLVTLFEGDNTLDAMDESFYFTVLDMAALRVIRLLRDDSFRRFKCSKLFGQFVSSTSLDLSRADSLRLDLSNPQIRIMKMNQAISSVISAVVTDTDSEHTDSDHIDSEHSDHSDASDD